MGERKLVWKAYPGSWYDLTGVENWLARQAAEGLRLERLGGFRNLAVFREEQPGSLRYFVVPELDKKKDTEAYLQALDTECTAKGWTRVRHDEGVLIVYETEDPWAAKPRWEPTEEQWCRKWRSMWSDVLFGVLGWLFIFWQLLEKIGAGDWTYYEFITVQPSFLGLEIAMVLLPLAAGYLRLRDIFTWKKVFRRGETVGHSRLIKGARWIQFLSVPLLLVMVVVMRVTAGPFARFSLHPMESVQREIPKVTVDLLEEELYYAPEPYGPDISVGFRRSPMVPKEVHVHSLGMFEDLGTVENWMAAEHTRNYDARLDFVYYRLWSRAMACRMAEDEAMRHGGRLLDETGGFDAVWISPMDEYGYQDLSAWDGDVVITMLYKGGGDLEDHLSEIHQIVMDYRGN